MTATWEMLTQVLQASRETGKVRISDLMSRLNVKLETVVDLISEFMEYLQPDNENIVVEFERDTRLDIALRAVGLGGDITQIAKQLTWQEFERLCLLILDRNHYTCRLNYRFSGHKKRHEIDVLALKKPMILIIDAKHWITQKNHTSGLKQAAKEHLTRTKDLIDQLPSLMFKLGIQSWKQATIIPILVSLYDENMRILSSAVVVPVFKFNEFLLKLHMYVDEVRHLVVDLPEYKKLSEYRD